MKKLSFSFPRFLAIVVVGGFFVGACLAAVIPGARVIAQAHHFSGEFGSLGELSQKTTVLAADGTQIGELGTENREPVELEAVPQVIIDAVIAIEDRTFYENSGVDVGAVFRALVENVTSGEIEQGGSTITQQLVKNRVLSAERDLDRKVREIVLAYRLNDQFTKNQILEQYLNTVYFGQGSYGIKSAVERYNLDELKTLPEDPARPESAITVAEAALIAGLIRNPEGDNPFINPDRAIARRADVLDAMVGQGFITQEQADAAAVEPLPTQLPPAELRPDNDFVEEVQSQLLEDPRLGETPEDRQNAVLQGGLTVETSYDQAMQDKAQAAVAPGNNKPRFTAALVAIEPATGFVKAMVNGEGFGEAGFNVVTDGFGQQAGSTWKVITLATLLQNGYSANDQVDGSSPCRLGTWGQTSNAGDGAGSGVQTVRRQTTNSVNCAFARMQLSVSSEKVVEMAHALGIKTRPNPLVPESPDALLPPVLTMTLGTIESTPLEMATVAATIANGGVRKGPHFITRVTTPDGTVLIDNTTDQGTRAMDAGAAACEIDILRGVVTSGTGTRANFSGHIPVGKTGTTDETVDAAFLGMVPQLAAFVWHGSPDGNVPGAGFGGEIPAGIWRDFMSSAMEGQEQMEWPEPGPQCSAAGRFIDPFKGRTSSSVGTVTEDTTPVTPPSTVPPVTAPTVSVPDLTVPTSPTTTTTTTTTQPPIINP